ncbi:MULTISPECIES: SEFIR domain-containing protein [unclassified Streptomyces]|uniref:SEFIR domain-containing protein n=1 Tax=unclassified Streptomyces TaxID=2593676 RepID=UPI00403C30AD
MSSTDDDVDVNGYEGGWAEEAGLLRVDREVTTARVDTAAVDRAAFLLDVQPKEVMVALRGMMRLHATEVPPFEMGTGAWRIDLPGALARSVVSGVVAAMLLRLLGADDLPLTVLGAVAPLAFEIKRVEVLPSDVIIQAQLAAAVGDGVCSAAELYQTLPEEVRQELTVVEFADVLERLVKARQALVTGKGLRVRAPGSRRGFRLVLWDAPLLPQVLLLASAPAIPGRTPALDPPAAAEPAYHPKVFISYAQETPEHKAKVADFGRFLSACGIRVRMDQWGDLERRDWQLWATHEIGAADFVLIVASPACRTVGDGLNHPEDNRGLAAEMRTLRELYHSDNPVWRRRMLPVVLPGGSVDDIPLFLQPRTADHYKVLDFSIEGSEDLLRLLTGQPLLREPSLGTIPTLPADEPGTP